LKIQGLRVERKKALVIHLILQGRLHEWGLRSTHRGENTLERPAMKNAVNTLTENRAQTIPFI